MDHTALLEGARTLVERRRRELIELGQDPLRVAQAKLVDRLRRRFDGARP
jgi:hypothetical protein